jgi:hypothetical protein
MHKLAMTMAASAAILCLGSLGWSANAVTGPGGLPGAIPRPRGRRPHAKDGGGIVRQDTSARAARIVAGAAPAGDPRNGDLFPLHAAFCFGRTSGARREVGGAWLGLRALRRGSFSTWPPISHAARAAACREFAN